TTIWSAQFSIWSGYFLNNGSLTITSDGFSLGSYYNTDPLTIFQNQLGGTVVANGPCLIADESGCAGANCHDGGNSLLINYGTMQFNAGGTIESDISLYNPGSLYLYGGTLTATNIGSIQSGGGELYEGAWQLYNGAHLATDGRDITQIDSGATIYLSGSGAFMDGAPRVQTVYGTLVSDFGCNFSLTPYFFGSVTNHGVVAVGPGAVITVFGSYINASDGKLDIVVADGTPSGKGFIQSYSA